MVVTVVDDKHRGFALGAADYLMKPIDREQLLGTIRRYTQAPDESYIEQDILVVEDDADTRAFLRQVLEKEGYPVREAINGRIGLDAVMRQAPSPRAA